MSKHFRQLPPGQAGKQRADAPGPAHLNPEQKLAGELRIHRNSSRGLDNLWKMNIAITMDIDPDFLDQIPLPQELLEQTPEPVLVFLMQLLAENQLLRARIVQLEAKIQALHARIEQLEARLNRTPPIPTSRL